MDPVSLAKAGVARGILPPHAVETPVRAGHPWPLVLLSFLGAQLAALPFIGFALSIFGEALQRGGGAYLLGVPVLLGACAALRGKQLPLFAENLALVALMVGIGLICFATVRDLEGYAYPLCALLALAVAAWVPVNWVRGVLGALAAALLLGTEFDSESLQRRLWTGATTLTALWLAGLWGQSRLSGTMARTAIALEWILAGWLLAALAGLAMLGGMSFMVGGVLGAGELGALLVQETTRTRYDLNGVQAAFSALLCVAAGIWCSLRWASLRKVSFGGLIGVLAGLGWFMPALGPAVLICAVTLVTRRRLLAGAAAFCAAWIIGAFYYNLAWDLLTKAQVLAAGGAALACLAWLASCRRARSGVPTLHPAAWRELRLMVLAIVLTFGVVNVGVWQKENLIAHGRPVFVRLAPMDPRSLMQGDFMALNYAMEPALQGQLAGVPALARPRAVAGLDGRGVATLRRLATGSPLAPDEILIELSPKKGRWMIASDAWFFKEGEGERWRPAHYGEFRVTADGQALLVGMADESLMRLPRSGASQR